jgi:hypothetical protein
MHVDRISTNGATQQLEKDLVIPPSMKDVHPIVSALNDMRTDSVYEDPRSSSHAWCRAIDDPGRASGKPEENWLVLYEHVEILRTEADGWYENVSTWGQTWV